MSGQVRSVRLTDEWAERVDMMARLDVEFPKGVTSVLQDGVEVMWNTYGGLAEQMAQAAAKVRKDTPLDPIDQEASELNRAGYDPGYGYDPGGGGP